MASLPSRSSKLPFGTYLFDLDGTLIDSVELILGGYRHAAQLHLGFVPPDDVWLAGMGTPLRRQMEGLTDDPELLEAMIETYREYNRQYHDVLLREFPGARAVVELLHRLGAKLGVVTSKLGRSARRGLGRCGLNDLFPVVVAADDVEHHKPHPAPVLLALKRLGAEAKEAIFIGDSPHDLAAGRAAGVFTAAALWGPIARPLLELHQPDFWLNCLDDVASIERGPGRQDASLSGEGAPLK